MLIVHFIAETVCSKSNVLVLLFQWVAEGSPSHSSTPVKIESALQFVPQGTNPKEFKQKQQQVSWSKPMSLLIYWVVCATFHSLNGKENSYLLDII